MQLKPFQEEGLDFLVSHRYALLADEMRLGKTGQAIRAAHAVGARRILVVCPAVAKTMWRRAFKTWWLGGSQPTVRVATYDRVRNHTKSYTRGHWDLLIVDESHYVKSISAGRTKAVLGKGGVAHCAGRVWAMSGTPMPNHPGELWPLLYVFRATRMGYEHFLRHFCRVDSAGRVRGTKKSTLPELHAMLKPIMLRRLTKDVAPELPKTSVIPYHVEADSDFLDLAHPVEAQAQGKLDKARNLDRKVKRETAGMEDAELLDYLDSHVEELATLRRITSLLKAPAVCTLLQDELDLGILDKCVVYGYHTEALCSMKGLMAGRGYKVDLLYGGTPKKKRDAMLVRFDRPASRGGTQVLFAQIQAAGTAIDLSAAHNGFMIELDWTPANNAQAMMRMGGYRQTKPVTVRSIVLEGSIDEAVSQVLNRKIATLADVYQEEV